MPAAMACSRDDDTVALRALQARVSVALLPTDAGQASALQQGTWAAALESQLTDTWGPFPTPVYLRGGQSGVIFPPL